MSLRTNKKSAGFTLVEIMIVVLIIGVLLAIAVPNFVKARDSSRTKSCIANLRQIDAAKEQYAMDTKKSTGDAVALANLAPDYIKTAPVCPSGTAAYVPGNVGVTPPCPNVATNASHVLP